MRRFQKILNNSTKYLNLLFWIMIIVFIIFSVVKNQSIEFINDEGNSFRSDYLLHFLGYLGLAILSLINNFEGNKKQSSPYTKILIVFAVAILTECIQYFLPWRKFNHLDILMNVSGVITGIIITFLILFPLISRILKNAHIDPPLTGS